MKLWGAPGQTATATSGVGGDGRRRSPAIAPDCPPNPVDWPVPTYRSRKRRIESDPASMNNTVNKLFGHRAGRGRVRGAGRVGEGAT